MDHLLILIFAENFLEKFSLRTLSTRCQIFHGEISYQKLKFVFALLRENLNYIKQLNGHPSFIFV